MGANEHGVEQVNSEKKNGTIRLAMLQGTILAMIPLTFLTKVKIWDIPVGRLFQNKRGYSGDQNGTIIFPNKCLYSVKLKE